MNRPEPQSAAAPEDVGTLVLSRREGQTIDIGDAEVTIIHIREGRTRVMVKAPKTTPVYRREVLERMRAENQSSGGDRPSAA